MGENCTHSIDCITLITQVSVYTQAKIYSSRNFVPMNDIQTSTFHPTMHQKPTNPTWCLKCKCIIIIGIGLLEFNSNHLLALTKLLTQRNWKASFPSSMPPQRVTPSSAYLKGLLVISDTKEKLGSSIPSSTCLKGSFINISSIKVPILKKSTGLTVHTLVYNM